MEWWLYAVHAFNLLVLHLGVYLFTGWTWPYLFRGREHRDITALLRGAIALGPEGWERDSRVNGGWVTRAGDIQLARVYERDGYEPKFHIGGAELPLDYRPDRLRVHRAVKRWAHAANVSAERRALRESLAAANAHLNANRDALDKLDHEVVVARRRAYV